MLCNFPQIFFKMLNNIRKSNKTKKGLTSVSCRMKEVCWFGEWTADCQGKLGTNIHLRGHAERNDFILISQNFWLCIVLPKSTLLVQHNIYLSRLSLKPDDFINTAYFVCEHRCLAW